MIVWAPFSAPTLDTCQTAPSEPQFCPLRLESNCSGCQEPARGCLQVLDKQKNRNFRQLCPDPSRPSVGRYRNCVTTSERQTTPGFYRSETTGIEFLRDFASTLVPETIQFYVFFGKNVYSTMYSQAVTHPSTNMAQCCLTSVIRRELVFST